MKKSHHTHQAPAAIGPYSQAIESNGFLFVSGQIAMTANNPELPEGIEAQIEQVFENLEAIAKAAGGSLNDFVRVTIYLIDLAHFPKINEQMEKRFSAPYPSRVTIGVQALPRGALVEVDAIMVKNNDSL
jgi:reactive intermediate/imine deaminase